MKLCINIKDDCKVCQKNYQKLTAFTYLTPTKYGNQIILTLNQDWLGGDLWHIHKVEFDNYEDKE